jgi:hypothetical protein
MNTELSRRTGLRPFDLDQAHERKAMGELLGQISDTSHAGPLRGFPCIPRSGAAAPGRSSHVSLNSSYGELGGNGPLPVGPSQTDWACPWNQGANCTLESEVSNSARVREAGVIGGACCRGLGP